MDSTLTEQHRRLEVHLDRLGEAIRQNEPEAIGAAVREFMAEARPHYEWEEAAVFPATGLAEFTGKLARQHRQVCELAEALQAAVSLTDLVRIARELQALAQHNIIEEERDLWPLLKRNSTQGECSHAQPGTAAKPRI